MRPASRAPRARWPGALAVTGLLAVVAFGGGSSGATSTWHSPSSSTAALGDFGSTTSSNWSGYTAIGATFSDVIGSWTQPAVPCSGPVQYASFWVGMDGYQTGDKTQVEQVGTDSDCLKVKVKGKGGRKLTPVYFGWWEMFPGPVVKLPASSCPVQAGDAMTAEVSASAGQFTFTLSDLTQGWKCASDPQPSSAPAASAEWIVEAPFSLTSGRVLKLADFGSVGFGGARANGTAISALSNDSITMQVKRTVKASPSALGPDGSSFTVTWQHG